MHGNVRLLIAFMGVSVALAGLHLTRLSLPYFWDEAGYYIPAAWDFYKAWELVPTSTLPNGHTPLVMIYLALAWHIFGFSAVVTRVAMAMMAAATVVATFALARRVTAREPAVWSAALLAISPMFFAQSTLVYLDLPAALFTTLAMLALLDERMPCFGVDASLAVMSKETAIVILPVAWAWAWWQRRNGADHRSALQPGRGQAPPLRWIALLVPVVPLVAWMFYYHSMTGFWTGNAEYLQYNLFSTLSPARFSWTLLRRLYELFLGGFNWLPVAGAALGLWLGRRQNRRDAEDAESIHSFLGLASGLTLAYIFLLSVVGGAVLPRYLLPVFPVFFVACVSLIWRLPKAVARAVCGTAAACFVAAWFINPPYPFAFENNLAYADFIRLHQNAARYLESRPPGERILTAWPATDEISRPFLGYVSKPLCAVPLEGLTEKDFEKIEPGSFDVVYLYSRKWEPPENWLERFPAFLRAQRAYFGYAPQVSDEWLRQRFGLVLEREFERRGQWVRVYSRRWRRSGGTSPSHETPRRGPPTAGISCGA